MIFVLIRLMPVLLAAAYLALAAVLLWTYQWWWVWAAITILLIVAWSGLIVWHSRIWRSILAGAYLAVYAAVGFGFVLMIDQYTLLAAFVLAWSIFFWMLTEALFHYLYQTDKVAVINPKYIVYCINIAIVFALGAVAANLVLFLGLLWLWSVLIVFGVVLVTGLMQLLVYDKLAWPAIYIALIGALMMTEIYTALLWWPVSFYVLGALLATIYYWFASVIVARWEDRYDQKSLLQSSAITLALLAIVLVTAKWL